jgi:hypothetical protein
VHVLNVQGVRNSVVEPGVPEAVSAGAGLARQVSEPMQEVGAVENSVDDGVGEESS